MPCYHPLRAFEAGRSEDGKKVLSWKRNGTEGVELFLPCGQCIGCRLERSRQWAVRCMHEADMHDANCFITLTYDEAHLPMGGSLVLEDWQGFMKRLRKKVGFPLRFFHAGEYGERQGRPHYHALLFGYDFPDKVFLREENGCKLFSSPSLIETWGKGLAVIGALTFESAAYVARYCLKKVTGDASEEAYTDCVTGVMRRPEYCTMSRRPGIGHGWFKEFRRDVFPSDEVIVRGKSCKPPRYYEKLLDKVDPEGLESVKMEREAEAVKGVRESFRNVYDGSRFAAGSVVVSVSDSARLERAEKLKRASIRSMSRRLE